MTFPNDPMLAAALRCVADACRVTRSVQNDPGRIRQFSKDDRSPVTVADFAAQALVALTLRETLGDVHIVGEEHAGQLREDDQAAVRDEVVAAVRTCRPGVTADEVLDAIDACAHDASAGRFWTLDPVDGTKGFLRGQQYAVALGLIEDGVVTRAVMGCPNLPAAGGTDDFDAADPHGAIYAAAAGGGAWEWRGGDVTASPRPITAARSAAGRPVRVCESVEAAHSDRSVSARVIEAIGESSTPVRVDSQCKYSLVARGSADAYLRLPTRKGYVEKIWDHAPGMLIATEAGAVVTDVNGVPLAFDAGERLERNRGIVCAIAELHERIIGTIAAVGKTAAS